MQSMHSTKFTRRTAEVTTRLLRAFSRREWILPTCSVRNDFRRASCVHDFRARHTLYLSPIRTCRRIHIYPCIKTHTHIHICTYIVVPDRYPDDRYAHVLVFLFIFASSDPFAIPWQAARIAVRPNQDAGSEVRRAAPLGSTHFKMNFSLLSLSLSFSCSFFYAKCSGRTRPRRQSLETPVYFSERICDFLERNVSINIINRSIDEEIFLRY